MRRVAPMIAALALLAACASSTPSVQPTTTGGPAPSTAPSTTAPVTSPATTTPATTTSPATTTPVTTSPTTPTTPTTEPAASSTTVEPCPTGASDAAVVVAFPDRMSPLVGRDIRTGAHPCFERVVIELQAATDGRTTPFPGYAVRYVPLPVSDSPRGEPVTLDGTDALLVSVAVWMQSMEGDGYDGPTDVHPTNVRHIRELRMVENFEGMTAWAIGLDGHYPFTVTVLDAPPRLVLDVIVS